MNITENEKNRITRVAVLGSTGSVGCQALEVIGADKSLSLVALTAKRNVTEAERQARLFLPLYAALEDESAAAELRIRLADTPVKVLGGKDGVAEAIALCGADVFLNSVLGFDGLFTTLHVISLGKRLALANKESIVVAGELVMARAAASGTEIVPVDSEHCAIHQCLRAGTKREVKRLILTASGGPFFGYSKDRLRSVTLEQTLAHPTWSMGRKITVDSATMMNKGFELIEAARLFGIPGERVSYVVHRESIIHSMVEYIDNAVIAQLSVPDMRYCAKYALTYPQRSAGLTEELDLTKVGSLTFSAPDTDAFPLPRLAQKALADGSIFPAALNAANEVAVAAFLDRSIAFCDIAETVTQVYGNTHACHGELTESCIREADASAREAARSFISHLPRR